MFDEKQGVKKATVVLKNEAKKDYHTFLGLIRCILVFVRSFAWWKAACEDSNSGFFHEDEYYIALLCWNVVAMESLISRNFCLP